MALARTSHAVLGLARIGRGAPGQQMPDSMRAFIANTDYVGEGYGIPTESGLEAIAIGCR